MAYTEGALKQDPVTKSVAVKNPDSFIKPWSVMRPGLGGYHADDEQVADWTDIPNTPVPEPAPAKKEKKK